MYRGPRRKRLRLKRYNYSLPGEYFITICTKGLKHHFGKVINENVLLSPIGRIAKYCWSDIPNHFHHTALDEFIIMPNHIHGIDIIKMKPVSLVLKKTSVVNADLRSLRNTDKNQIKQGKQKINRTKMLIPKIIHGFKSSVTRIVNKLFVNNTFAWQKSYYDHIIQTEEALDNIRNYIRLNPINWEGDNNYKNF